jgi:hypothetical protein
LLQHVERIVAWLIVDYFTSHWLVVDYSASRRSSSTTSPTPHVLVPRLVAPLVVD